MTSIQPSWLSSASLDGCGDCSALSSGLHGRDRPGRVSALRRRTACTGADLHADGRGRDRAGCVFPRRDKVKPLHELHRPSIRGSHTTLSSEATARLLGAATGVSGLLAGLRWCFVLLAVGDHIARLAVGLGRPRTPDAPIEGRDRRPFGLLVAVSLCERL